MELRLLATALLVLTLAGCGDREAPARPFPAGGNALSGRLVLTGATTVSPLILEIAKRFEDQHRGVRIDVQTGGSSRGIKDARNGTADIGMSSRPLTAEEAATLEAHVVARDGVCFLVHRDNPVNSLTDAQIKDIYSGVVHNWRDVGGADRQMVVINRAGGRSELTLFSEHFGLAPEKMRADLIAGENQQGIKLVVGNPDALIYISLGESVYEREHGAPLKLLSLNGIDASVANVANGKYPLTRPLLLVTNRETVTPLARAFIDYALSAQVHDLVTAHAFVPIH